MNKWRWLQLLAIIIAGGMGIIAVIRGEPLWTKLISGFYIGFSGHDLLISLLRKGKLKKLREIRQNKVNPKVQTIGKDETPA